MSKMIERVVNAIVYADQCSEPGLSDYEAMARAAIEATQVERLRGLLKQTRNYVDRDHYGVLAEIDAALATEPVPVD